MRIEQFFELMEKENRVIANLLGENPTDYVETFVVRNSKWTKYYNSKYNKNIIANDDAIPTSK